MSGSSRRCGTCRWFKDAGMGGTGWCTHPKRQTSSDVRILVRRAELACRNAWGEDLWEALDADESDDHVSPVSPSAPIETDDVPMHISFDDEVTSVVDADIHRAQSQPDLNDRVMRESNLELDDDDERFDPRARSGRDSVSRARDRLLRRRGEPGDLSDQTPSDERSDQTRFAPDDFVEDEEPARSPKQPPEEHSPFDDIVLDENVARGTPRSRRLRRERQAPNRPKPAATAGANPDAPVPAKTSGTTEHVAGDLFNTVPEISSDIDISRLRNPNRPPSTPETPATLKPAPEAVEDAFERDILSVNAIRAAARAEREGRQRDARRAQIIPRQRTAPEVPHQEPLGAHATEQPVPVVSDSPRPRISTRDVDDTPVMFEHAAALEFDDTATQSPREVDPRTSWWRGMFQSRQRSDALSEPAEERYERVDYDDYLELLSSPHEQDMAWIDHDAEADTRRQPHYQPAQSRSPDQSDLATPMPVRNPVSDDLDDPAGMDAYRERLFGYERESAAAPSRRSEPRSAIVAQDLLQSPDDAWYEPEPVPEFDIRHIIEEEQTLLDMTIEITPDVPRQCSTCRSYRQAEHGERGWCTNNWAFTHRQMVNATDLACDSTIGCWWLPADEEVWFDDREPEPVRTPRIDRLIAHLDPLKRAANN